MEFAYSIFRKVDANQINLTVVKNKNVSLFYYKNKHAGHLFLNF